MKNGKKKMDATQINNKIKEWRKGKIKQYPCEHLRASLVGHPCERYLALSIANWQDKLPYDETRQAIYDFGNSVESYAIDCLKKAGFEVVTPVDRAFRIENPLITGREDLRIKDQDSGELIPVEIKGLQGQEWEKLNSVDDFKNSKHHYIKQYPAQLYCYMWHFQKEKGYFCLVNKQTGQIKIIEVKLDYDYMDWILERSKRVYKALEDKTINQLETIDDYSTCDKCDLKHCCKGCHKGVEAEIDDGTLENLIREKAQLKANADRYKEIGEEIKYVLGKREKVIAGEWIVTKSQVEKKSYVVQGGTYEQVRIKKL